MKCKYCGKNFEPKEYRPYSDGFCGWDCRSATKQLQILKSNGYEVPKGYVAPADLPLTEAQESFCMAYVETRSYTKAFKTAFQDWCKNLKPAQIRAKGRFMLLLPFIRRRIHEIAGAVVEALPSHKDNILEKFVTIANIDIREYYDEDGKIRPPKEWTYEMGIACRKITRKYDNKGNLREESLELYNRLQALESLAKIEKMYRETLDVNVTHTLADTIKTFGDDDMVAKLIKNEQKSIEQIAAKDAIDVEVDGD